MKQYKYRRNSMELNDSIINIKGIGEKSEKLFNKLGISTVGELLCYYPREYEIFRQIEPISGVAEGRTGIVEGSIKTQSIKTWQSENNRVRYKGLHRTIESSVV